MKENFSEFYDKPEFKKLWKGCFFIFDANVFINLYGYSKETYDEFINILEKIHDRLWMPHQIGWEYQKNRLSGIQKVSEYYNSLNGLTGDLEPKLKKIRKSIKDSTKLQDDYLDKNLVNECLDEIDANIEKMNKGIKKPNLNEDKIRDKIDSIYEGKVGSAYPISRLKKIYKESEYRYANKIPPGFRDQNKKSGNPLGDLILWNQMIDYAKHNNKSLILITEDGKDDWWLNGEPHPHLIKEFSSTGQEFYIYNFSNFLTEARNYLKAKIKQENIAKVKETEIKREISDIKDKLLGSDGISVYNNEFALLFFKLIANEPELFNKMIKPGYKLTEEDNFQLLKLLADDPNLLKKVLINSGQNLTEKDNLMLNILSKSPEILDFIHNEGKSAFDMETKEDSSQTINKKKKQENKNSSKKKPPSNKKKNARRRGKKR